MVIALLAACIADKAEDSAGPAVPECDATTITLAQELLPVDLPANGALEHQGPGVALGDIDGDDDLDALVAWAGGSVVLRNDGTGTMTPDSSADLDRGSWMRGASAALVDFDLDGDLDAYVGEYEGGEWLARNDEGHFTGIRLSEGAVGWSPWSGAWGDADGDGDLDLYVSNRPSDIEPPAVLAGTSYGIGNYLYINGGPGVFTRDDSRIPQDDNWGITFHSVWVDWDRDGDLDIYEANDWGHYVVPNRLLLNDGSGRFTADPTRHCDVPMYGMGAAVGDVEGDGWPDLYVTDIGSPDLLGNLEGVCFNATQSLGAYVAPSPTNLTSWGTAFTDMDRNGCPDLLVAFGRLGGTMDEYLEGITGVDGAGEDPLLQSNVLLLNDCAPSYSRLEGTDFDAFPERDRALVVGDLDRDGRADLVTAGRDFVRVWMAGGGCDNGVTVRLAMPGPNPAGIGSQVTVTTSEGSQVQWMLPSTMGSASAAELYFGLGDRTEGLVSVQWPDGSDTVDVAARAGDLLTIEP